MQTDIGANDSGTAQQGVNTSDGETQWREEWEERKEVGVKQKRSGWRKGGELKAVESGTTLCSLICYAPALPPPQHPHLHPCSLSIRPLLHTGLAGMLTFTPTHPLSVSHPSFSCKIGRNKGEAAPPVTSCAFV